MEVTTKPRERKRESVNRRTFNKWEFKDDFEILKMDDEGNITKLLCKICATHLSDIINEAHRRNLKGIVVNGIVKLAAGMECIHKGNLCRHIKTGGLHDWAKKKYGLESTLSSSPSTSSPAGVYTTQANDDTVILTDIRTQYKHLFNTALHVVRADLPFTEFPSLVQLQTKNGVHFVPGRDCAKCCRQFVAFLATVLRNDVEQMLHRANFFSGFVDSSQATAVGSEKELIYGKIVVKGCPTVLFMKCQDAYEVERDAENVKTAYDKTFLNAFKMPAERYAKLMVSVCTDSLLVCYDACLKLKQDHDRNWLLVMLCLNHHLELAVEDIFMSDAAFQRIDDMLMHIYYHFRNSREAKRVFVGIALALGVICESFHRCRGTHFQNNKYRALKSMLINFLPLCKYCEQITKIPKACKGDTAAKLRDYVDRFAFYGFLAKLNFYRQVLQITTHLSYVMQNRSMLLTDVIDAMRESVRRLNDLAQSDVSLPFEARVDKDDSVSIDSKATNLPATQAFKEKYELTTKEKRKTARLTRITKQEHCLKNVKQGKESVKQIKEKIIPGITDAIKRRLAPFTAEEDIYTAVQLPDHSSWDYDDNAFGMDKIKKLSEHFSVPLEFHKYSMSKAMSEFIQLKALIHQKYRNHVNKLQVWKAIFLHYGGKFPHILLLVELCLSLAGSSSTVEMGYQACSSMLSKSSFIPKRNILDDVLMLRVNLPTMETLEPDYAKYLVDKSVDLFLSKPREECEKVMKHVRLPNVATIGSGFLPTPFSASENELLEDEEFPVSDSSDSDDEQSSDDVEDDDLLCNDCPMETEAPLSSDDGTGHLVFKIEPAWD